MTKTSKRMVGDLGEDMVCQYVTEKGYKVIERNYLRPWGEIDIVALKENHLHFIEVKTVTREPGRGAFRPEENMHFAKIQRLSRAIQTFILQNKIFRDLDWQIDLACVYVALETKKAKIELIENVF